MSYKDQSYEVQTYRNGKWSIALISDDKDIAVFEAQRRFQSTLVASVRVVHETYDTNSESFRSRVVFRRERGDVVGGREEEKPEKKAVGEKGGELKTAGVPAESKEKEKRSPIQWTLQVLFGVLFLAGAGAGLWRHLAYEPAKPPSVAARTAPPVAARTAPPVAARTAPPVAARTAPSVAARTVPPVAAKPPSVTARTAPPVAAKPPSVTATRTAPPWGLPGESESALPGDAEETLFEKAKRTLFKEAEEVPPIEVKEDYPKEAEGTRFWKGAKVLPQSGRTLPSAVAGPVRHGEVTYYTLKLFTLKQLRDGRVSMDVTLVVALDVVGQNGLRRVERKVGSLHNAIYTKLSQIVSMDNSNREVFKTTKLSRTLKAVCDEELGPGFIRDVLILTLWRKR